MEDQYVFLSPSKARNAKCCSFSEEEDTLKERSELLLVKKGVLIGEGGEFEEEDFKPKTYHKILLNNRLTFFFHSKETNGWTNLCRKFWAEPANYLK